jgi:dTDP-4-dehydrorhamnose reductase
MGCNGMLGKELTGLCDAGKIEYTGTDRECDITDIEALRSFSRGKKIDWIVNCSAYTAVDKAEDEEDLAYKINAEGAGNIARIAAETGAKLIHISTDYVFDGKGTRPYVETDPVCPVSAYGRTKLAGERLISEAASKYFIIRTAWLYGKNGNNFVHTMIRLFREKESLNVVSDQKGSPTWTFDLATTILAIVKSGSTEYGIYHFSNEDVTTWHEFSCAILRHAKEKGIVSREVAIHPVTTDQYPTKAVRPHYSVLDKGKIKRTFSIDVPGWEKSLVTYLSTYKG